MNLHVFIKGKQVVVETNLEFAIPYWTQRQALRPELHITFVEIKKP